MKHILSYLNENNWDLRVCFKQLPPQLKVTVLVNYDMQNFTKLTYQWLRLIHSSHDIIVNINFAKKETSHNVKNNMREKIYYRGLSFNKTVYYFR